MTIRLRVGVLASGGGSNLQSIIGACEEGRVAAEVVLVISNNSAAGALARARTHSITAIHLSSHSHPDAGELDRAILHALTAGGAEYVALAGYMKKLGPETLAYYRNRILNIHPSLLPDFGGQGMYGMRVHRAVIASGAEVSGPTVHLVTAEYDEGPILAQQQVPVLADDDPEALQRRVLEAEHSIYPDTLDEIARGRIAIHEGVLATIIRPIRLDRDFDEASDVVRSGFQTQATRFGLTHENYPSHASFCDLLRLRKVVEAGGAFFCAYQAGAVKGCVAVEPFRDEPGSWFLEKLVVLPEYRLKGLGALLLEHGCAAVSSFGGRRVSIVLIDKDDELKSWYRLRGFVETGTRELSHLPFTVCSMARELG